MDNLLDLNPEQYIDLDGALARVRGNKKLFRRMLELFFESDEFAKFDQSLSSDKISESAEIAHAIKGMTGNLSMNALFEASTKLMNELRAGEKNQASIDEYQRAYQNTLAAAKALAAELDAE